MRLYEWVINENGPGFVCSSLEGRKSLNIKTETWERLQSFGKFRESSDELLNRLMDNMAKVSKK